MEATFTRDAAKGALRYVKVVGRCSKNIYDSFTPKNGVVVCSTPPRRGEFICFYQRPGDKLTIYYNPVCDYCYGDIEPRSDKDIAVLDSREVCEWLVSCEDAGWYSCGRFQNPKSAVKLMAKYLNSKKR